MASFENDRNIPSPRFSVAGSQESSRDKRSHLDVKVELAVDVGKSGVEPCETDLRGYLTQSVDQHQSIDRAVSAAWERPDRLRAGIEVALGFVLAEGILLRQKSFDLGLLDTLLAWRSSTQGAASDLGPHNGIGRVFKSRSYLFLPALLAQVGLALAVL